MPYFNTVYAVAAPRSARLDQLPWTTPGSLLRVLKRPNYANDFYYVWTHKINANGHAR